MFQLIILIQPKSDGYFIQPVLRQDHHQIVYPSDHLYTLVSCPALHIIVKDPPYEIAPLGIRFYAVYILLRSPAVANQQDMLQIHALLPHIHEYHADQDAHQHLQAHVQSEEHKNHLS